MFICGIGDGGRERGVILPRDSGRVMGLSFLRDASAQARDVFGSGGCGTELVCALSEQGVERFRAGARGATRPTRLRRSSSRRCWLVAVWI